MYSPRQTQTQLYSGQENGIIHTFKLGLHKNSNTHIYIEGQKRKPLSMITTLDIPNSEGSTNSSHMHNVDKSQSY